MSGRGLQVDLRFVDRVCIAYALLVAALAAAVGPTLIHGRSRVIEAAAVALAIVLLVAVAGGRRGLFGIVRTLYPLGFLMWAWTRLDGAIPALYGDYWFSDWLIRADRAIFGGLPTVQVQALYRPWLDELMALMYLSYYLFLAVPVLLVIRRRHDAALAGLGAIIFTYAVNFLLFFLLPAKSPPQLVDEYAALVPSRFDGFVATDLVRVLQSAEGVVGAAFPSSHVAGATVCTLVAARTLPRVAPLLWTLLVGMSLATVYLGYHHGVDTIAGVALGVVCFIVAVRWLRRVGEIPGRL